MTHHSQVYVVDDDPSARNGLERVLRVGGYAVQAFNSAETFLASRPDVGGACLVLDARMPGLSGEALHQRLETSGIELPIIFVTADDDPETKRRAQELHAAGFFRKPVDAAALMDAIEWALVNWTSGKEEAG